jgi:hypothetical protein
MIKETPMQQIEAGSSTTSALCARGVLQRCWSWHVPTVLERLLALNPMRCLQSCGKQQCITGGSNCTCVSAVLGTAASASMRPVVLHGV